MIGFWANFIETSTEMMVYTICCNQQKPETLMKRLFYFAFLSFFSFTVLAGDGAVSIKTEPRDAQVFLDGELKSMSTPIVLQKVKPGKHSIKAQAGDKQAVKEIFVPADGVISVTLTLEGSVPDIPVNNILDYYQPQRDSFETEAKFVPQNNASTSVLFFYLKLYHFYKPHNAFPLNVAL
jgi:hypothetical protein